MILLCIPKKGAEIPVEKQPKYSIFSRLSAVDVIQLSSLSQSAVSSAVSFVG
jgi:hypothetical protein